MLYTIFLICTCWIVLLYRHNITTNKSQLFAGEINIVKLLNITPAVRPLELQNAAWKTLKTDENDSELVRKIKTSGFFASWGIPFSNAEDVKHIVTNHNTLVLGDSYLQNVFIELSELYFNRVSNTSTSNPTKKVNGTKVKEHPKRSDYLSMSIKELQLRNVPLHYVGSYDNICNIPRIGSYYINMLTQLIDNLSNECFMEWLSQFDTILCDVYVHDISRKKLNREEYVQKMDLFFHKLPPQIKQKFIWLTPKSLRTTKTPAKYVKRQAARLIINNITNVLRQHDVTYIDFFTSTLTCLWKNCTLADHHHSRMVARSVAMRLLDIIQHRTRQKKNKSNNLYV